MATKAKPKVGKVKKAVEEPVAVEVKEPVEQKPWMPEIGEKFELCTSPVGDGEVASIDSYDPLVVTIHEVVNGCVTSRQWAGQSLNACAMLPLTKQEAFIRLAS